MKYENFEKIVLELQKQEAILSDLYSKKVDLIEFVEPYNIIIDLLIAEIYGEEGYDWFIWFCVENDFGNGNLDATDENGKICYDIKSLWEYLEKNHSK